MSTQHAPEPWNLHPAGEGYDFQIVDSAGYYVGKLNRRVHGRPTSESNQANASRIVACINACKGINPEVVPDLLEALRSMLAALNVALSAEADTFGVHYNDAIDAMIAAEAAIAKATNTTKH